jgi:hypothetical protein
MPLVRRRPLLRAAAVGGGAYVAGKRRAQSQQPADAAAPPPAAAPAGPSPDTMEQLRQLGDLRAQGVLTEEEFAQQKARLLA